MNSKIPLRAAFSGLLLTTAVIMAALLLGPTAQVSAQETNTLVTILNVPLCPDVFATSPENPAFIGPNEGARFAWSGEPAGTARRDFVAFDFMAQPDGTHLSSGNLMVEGANPLEHTTTISVGNAIPGTYNWMAVFYDGNNVPICRTNSYWLDVRGGGGSPTSGSEAGTAAGAVVVASCNGTFVVILSGSPFGGVSDIPVAGNDFDGSGLNACNLTIHGNNAANTLTGGAGNDQIFGYAGNDTLNGGDGDDELNGGDETCNGAGGAGVPGGAGGACGDTLNGGDGDDTLNGGNENCAGGHSAGANAGDGGACGDTLDGRDGDDQLNGGNENCAGGLSAGGDGGDGGACGDTLTGGDGNDTLNGGNENCDGGITAGGNGGDGGACGDTLTGGEGDDILNGGDENCDGGLAIGAGGACGDTLAGGNDADVINGGDEGCAGNPAGTCGDDIVGDSTGDNSDPGVDTIDAGDPADADTCDGGGDGDTVSNC